MVVLGVHDSPLPGRYWGEGQAPAASPSQASLLLARLNERARERKAGAGRGTPRHGHQMTGAGHAGKGTDLLTPQLVHTTDKEDKEEVVITSKAQLHETPTPLIQPRDEAKPKVNGVKLAESWSEETESVKSKEEKRKGEEEAEAPEVLAAEVDEDKCSLMRKKKKKRKKEREELLREEEVVGLLSLQEEEGESSLLRKKKKKRKREKEELLMEEEVESGVTCQRDDVISLQNDVSSEAPVTKKKKKKRKREEEESVKEGEVETLTSVISGVSHGTMESILKKEKKRKKHHEYQISEVQTGAIVDENSSVNKEKYVHSSNDVQASGEESFKEMHESQRKRKRKIGEEEVQTAANMEIEDKQAEKICDRQQGNTDTLLSPTKLKRIKDVKLEPKEEESKQDISSPLQVPKTKIKQEVVDTPEDLEDDKYLNNNNIENEATRKDMQEAKKKKGKKEKKKKKKEGKGKSREVGGFTLLTEVETTRRQKVQRTLPHWLANPTVIGRDLMADGTAVDSLPGLDPLLRDALKQQKIEQLFPVQRAVIPEVLAGAGSLACRFRPRDVCVSAPTGSGKTLAYVLPLVQALRSRTVPRIRALVLLPVQELATQVFHVFQTYCRGTPLRVGKAVGHSTLQKEQTALVAHHLDRHHSLVDILVATPGRLADHLRMTRGLDLSALRYLVLDEADRMLAAEGGDWVAHVQRAITDHQAVWHSQPLPLPPLQRLLFSATLSSDPEQLQHVTLYHPKLFTVAAPAAGQDKSAAVVIGQYVRPAELREEYVVVEEEVKPLALHHLLVSGEGRHRVLIFTNSVQATHKLALLLAALSQGTSRVVAEFSSKRDKRQQILSQFTSGKIDVLVSSDAMARGLDIPDIDHVVSYDVTAATTYVHRIGRTARAGRPGTALSLVTKSTMGEFRRAISGGGEGACQLSLTAEELEPYEELYIAALASLKDTLAEEEREKRQNQSSGKGKKKRKQKRQRQQKKDLRTARLAQKKATENRGKVTVNANRLLRHLKRP